MHGLDEFVYQALVNCEECVAGDLRDTFPNLCWLQVKSRLAKAQLVWQPNRKLKAKDKQRECDLGFQIDDLLLICECKARRTNIKKAKGERHIINSMWQTSLKDLEQAQSLVQFIADNRKEPALSVPNSVRFIVPFVVYPAVSWIEQKLQPHCIGESIPRFITPEELGNLTKSDFVVMRNDPLTTQL